MSDYLRTMLVWIISSLAIFSFLVVILFRSGFVGDTRDEGGRLKQKQSLKGITIIALVFAFFLASVYLYDFSLFRNDTVSLWVVLLYNTILVMTFVLYDSFVIDLLVIGKIRPKFLNLSDTMNMQSMIAHVKRQFTIGWVFVIPIILVPSIIYALIN